MDHDVASLRTIYAIVCLQEAGWIGAPLIVTANVLLHALITPLDSESRNIIVIAFAFFVVTGLLTILGLVLISRVALDQQRRSFLLPYLTVKLARTVCIGTVSLYVLIKPELRRYYFYISVYGLFECTAALVATEIVFRSWQVIRRANLRRRLVPPSSSRRATLLRAARRGSIRSTRSDPNCPS